MGSTCSSSKPDSGRSPIEQMDRRLSDGVGNGSHGRSANGSAIEQQIDGAVLSREPRGGRSLLFDGIEEGGSRAASSYLFISYKGKSVPNSVLFKRTWMFLLSTCLLQPMTEISGEKCKRCGIYEQGSLVSDREFDEWELCPSDFSASQIYMHSKEKEMNATFVCHGCAKLESVSAEANTSSSSKEEGDNGSTVAIWMTLESIFLRHQTTLVRL